MKFSHISFQTANNKCATQTVRMLRLVYAYVVRMEQNQLFRVAARTNRHPSSLAGVNQSCSGVTPTGIRFNETKFSVFLNLFLSSNLERM